MGNYWKWDVKHQSRRYLKNLLTLLNSRGEP